MKQIVCLLAIVLLMTHIAPAQEPYPDPPAPLPTIIKAEYFIDIDPGVGNATPVSISSAPNIVNATGTVVFTGSALTNGIHYFFLRTLDANGKWSLTNFMIFDNFFIPVYETGGMNSLLTAAEYFIDTDPGPGNGIPISIPATSDVNGINVLVNLTGLSQGAHAIHVRTRDQGGRWSLRNYMFFDNSQQTPYPIVVSAPPISQVEYYIDTDPGFGNGNLITVASSADVNDFSFSLPMGGLTQGNHTIYIRGRQNPWSLSAYAEFMYGSTLPVNWLYVKAEVDGSDAVLNWATGSEENNAEFIVEYSTNGIRFDSVGTLPATNSSVGSSYRFRHLNPMAGAAYYRIRQVDEDGKSTLSKVVMVLFVQTTQQLILFPNPATETVHIFLPQSTSKARIEVYDNMGHLIKNLQQSVSGQNIVSIPVQRLPKGSYYVIVKLNEELKTLRFIKP
jgi:hypothetical protein